jgi:hypothetical protein
MAQVTPKTNTGEKLKDLLGSPEETKPTQEEIF